MEVTSVLIAESIVTGDELFAHPEWNPCELVRGKVLFLSPAGGQHGVVTGEIFGLMREYVKSRNLGKVFAAETGFFIERDPDTVRAPDVSFLARERIPAGGIPREFIPIVPDLAVEVLSPSDSWKELDSKAAEFLAAGVRLVWGVDPATRSARIYRGNRAILKLDETQALSGEDVLPGFELLLKDVF